MANRKENSIEKDILDNKNKNVLEEEAEVKVSKKIVLKSFFRRNFTNKFDKLKIKYKKDPKKFLVVMSSILIAFSMLIGSSYAYLTYVSKTNNTTKITAGTLALNFKNESNAITLSKALPQSDDDGLINSQEYVFTIENTGSIQAGYQINLNNICVVNQLYTLNDESVKANVCIPNEYIKVAIATRGNDYKILDYKTSNKNNYYVLDSGFLNSGKTKTYKMKLWLSYDTPNTYNSAGGQNVFYIGKLELLYSQGNKDKSSANEPVLSENMIPVYYDETDEVWKKADESNVDSTYEWYDYDEKMWANSVTVSSTNRSTYKSASPGTTIPMDDILTMQVWIPRYKYKIFNYNANGTTYVDPQLIDITFEEGTSSTGEVTCMDSISGTDGAPSEVCRLKSNNNACTDSLCNGKTYTHPAFTFGNDELEGIWVGKFETTGTISNITVKPDLSSLRNQNVSSFATNIMNMKNSGNRYGFNTTDDTHMMKNMEWGAVAYLSHSKYGTCDGNACKEVNVNNSSGFYTGRSGGSPTASSSTEGTYRYNQKEIEETTITPNVTNDATYPWSVTNGLYKSTNKTNSTTSNISFTFNAPSNSTYLSFDWSVSSESASYDYIYYTIKKDGTALSDTGTSTKIGGTSYGTDESSLTYLNVARKLDAGSYELIFTYTKDSSAARGTDTGYVKNIKVLDKPNISVNKTPIGEGQDGPSASTTHNIYGIYDMSGGSYEHVMGNIVSPDGTTMMSGGGSPYNSGYTGKVYDSGNYTLYTGVSYPASKYYDKYSYLSNDSNRIISKLGDAIREISSCSSFDCSDWYGDDSYTFSRGDSWLLRSGYYIGGFHAGLFASTSSNGGSDSLSRNSARIVISPIN